ncbi:MAG: IclR family transcriptional regulator [Leucobacter sp.]
MSSSQKPIEALARGLKILEVLSRSTGSMGNGQLARETGLPQSTVSRLTSSLVQLGYLRVDPSSGVYDLTPKNLRLGYPVLMKLPLGARAHRALDQLTETTGMTSAIAARDDLHMTFMVVSRARSRQGVPLAVGGRLPISVSAAGLAYVRALPEARQAKVTSSVLRDLAGRGQSGDSFERLVSAPPSDYVVSAGLWQEEIGGIATAVRIGGQLYSLTLVAKTNEFEEAEIEKDLAPALLDVAEAIAD